MTGPLQPHPALNQYYTSLDERLDYTRSLFDVTARQYERIDTVLSLGSGGWYRRRALRRSGLRPGARVLDVAVGTGLVARAALQVTQQRADVVGVDVSRNMLAQARRTLRIPLIQAGAEQLPVADGSVDFVSMGYALRHVSDLASTFQEFLRVLRPGGSLLLLEIARPDGRTMHGLTAWYLGRFVPSLCGWLMPDTSSAALMRYFWSTIEHCVSPEVILDELTVNGFVEVACDTDMQVFRAYRARKRG
jgi:demethylmenaquinone methyltransferase / 2-methoxy-6-polyprenyl-1,4-benzoquinol methylase